MLQSDNATELNCMHEYFEHSGILFQTSCVDTTQQNGRVERKHRHILNVARALRFVANLPLNFAVIVFWLQVTFSIELHPPCLVIKLLMKYYLTYLLHLMHCMSLGACVMLMTIA